MLQKMCAAVSDKGGGTVIDEKFAILRKAKEIQAAMERMADDLASTIHASFHVRIGNDVKAMGGTIESLRQMYSLFRVGFECEMRMGS